MIAYRRWNVTPDGRLESLTAGHLPNRAWDTASATAQCSPVMQACIERRVRHPVTVSTCGLYAYKAPVPACECGEPTHARHGAVGVVRLRGRGVEHEAGWRASRADVLALVDFTGRLSPTYGVPVYPDLAMMYGEWAPGVTGEWPEWPAWCLTWAQRVAMGYQAALAAQVTDSSLSSLSTALAGMRSTLDSWLSAVRPVLTAAARLSQLTSPPADEDPRERALRLRRERDTGPTRPRRWDQR